MSAQPGAVASRYTTLTPSVVPGTFLAYNVFTGALLELDEADYRRLESWAETAGAAAPRLPAKLWKRLSEAGMLVPADVDERELLRDIRTQARANPDRLMLTIAPTMQCNFRCTYCYETHRQEYMTPETEADVIRFIGRKLMRVRAVNVTWFGGEPLLNPDCLERVQSFTNDYAAARDIAVSRNLVTNGYLLSLEIIARLQALGDWDVVQVTLDGLPEVHDVRRVLRSGRGTWRRIVDNCGRALEAGLPVNFRVNVDGRNLDTLPDLLDLLAAEGVLPEAGISLGFVVDSTDACSHVKADVLSERDRAKAALRFDAELIRRGLAPATDLPGPVCGPICSVESKLGYVIAPSGLIFKCWNQVDRGPDEAIGHVGGNEAPNAAAELARWEKYDPFARSGCFDCGAFPTCQGGCPWEAERLARPDRGECDSFRFYPRETIKVAHLGHRAAR